MNLGLDVPFESSFLRPLCQDSLLILAQIIFKQETYSRLLLRTKVTIEAAQNKKSILKRILTTHIYLFWLLYLICK